jgi:hypothetical protein
MSDRNLLIKAAQSSCTYRPRYDDKYRCHHRRKKDGLCVFHLPKLTQAERASLSEGLQAVAETVDQEFRDGFLLHLAKGQDLGSVRRLDCRGFNFPSITMESGRFAIGFDCSYAVFSGEVSLDYSEFEGAVSVYDARFKDKITCYGTKFKEKVDFTFAKFDRSINLVEARFAAEVDFSFVDFHEEAHFSGARFAELAKFRGTEFCRGAWFSDAHFAKAGHFIGDNKHPLFQENCYLTGISMSRDAEVILERANLERASLMDTNLEAVLFIDVKWHRPESRVERWLGRSQTLWDEFRPLDSVGLVYRDTPGNVRDYEKIAQNYRQLVLSYEQRRDYDLAEAFHIGEMEMRRKKKAAYIAKPWLRASREWLNSYGVYRVLSNYGTSYVQAFLVLLILIFLFSSTFLYSGFRPTENPERIVEYDLLPDSSHHWVSSREWVSDYLSAMSLSASIVTFQKDRFYEPLPGIARFWLYVAIIGFTGQVAMTLLALRRRFKR